MNQLSRLSGARTVINYLDRTDELEATVVQNPFFEIARVMMLERYFARLANPNNPAIVQGEA